MTDRCYYCREAFTAEEWDIRHSGWDGVDVHEACCETFGPCWVPSPVDAEGGNGDT